MVQQYEEKNTKIKQLLVKTKKELADLRQAVCAFLSSIFESKYLWIASLFNLTRFLILQETDHLMLQASLKGELEASQQQVEVYKVRLFLLLKAFRNFHVEVSCHMGGFIHPRIHTKYTFAHTYFFPLNILHQPAFWASKSNNLFLYPLCLCITAWVI